MGEVVIVHALVIGSGNCVDKGTGDGYDCDGESDSVVRSVQYASPHHHGDTQFTIILTELPI